MKGVQYNKKTDLIINCIISEIDEATATADNQMLTSECQ